MITLQEPKKLQVPPTPFNLSPVTTPLVISEGSEVQAEVQGQVKTQVSSVTTPLVRVGQVPQVSRKIASPEIPKARASSSVTARNNIQTLKDNGVRHLYHFTDVSNLDSIREHGLCSWFKVDERKLEARKGSSSLSRTLDQRKGLADYVRLSFVRDHPMMFVALRDGRLSRAVLLRIKLEVVSRPGVLFCPQNAASSGVDSSPDPSVVRFDIIRARGHFGVSREEKKLYQAEVLVPSCVPPHLIEFPNADVRHVLLESKISTQTDVKVPSSLAKPAPTCSEFSGDKVRVEVSSTFSTISISSALSTSSACSTTSVSSSLPQLLAAGAGTSTLPLLLPACYSLLEGKGESHSAGCRSDVVSRGLGVSTYSSDLSMLQRLRLRHTAQLMKAFPNQAPRVDFSSCEFRGVGVCRNKSTGETRCCMARRCAEHMKPEYVCNCLLSAMAKIVYVCRLEKKDPCTLLIGRCEMQMKPSVANCKICIPGILTCDAHLVICGKPVHLACDFCLRFKCNSGACMYKRCCEDNARRVATAAQEDALAAKKIAAKPAVPPACSFENLKKPKN